ncbi:MAG: LamG domain-containing protein [Spirochaetales bacterium]|nr:LamG domain-containing protein [Spirochaetales bacterium]
MLKKSFFLFSICLAIVLAGCVSGPAGGESALLGEWKFDEGSGLEAADSSGNSVSAVLTEGTEWTEGKFGSCIKMNGKDNYAWIDGSFHLTYYTISLWFRAELLFRNMDIFSAYAPGIQHGILLEVRDDGTLRFLHRVPIGGSGGSDLRTQDTYNDSTWHHCALVKTAQEMIIYIDGEPKASMAETSGDPEEPYGVLLGALDIEREPDRFYKGSIDELRIYNTPMSPEEIMKLAQEE